MGTKVWDFMSNFLKISVSTKTLSTFKRQPHKMERKNNRRLLLECVWPFCGVGAERVKVTYRVLFTSTLIKRWPLIHWSFFTSDLFTPVFRIKKEKSLMKNKSNKKTFFAQIWFIRRYIYDVQDWHFTRIRFWQIAKNYSNEIS